MKSNRIATTLLSVLILSSVSVSFADGGDSGPMGERGDKTENPTPAANFLPFNILSAIGHGISKITGLPRVAGSNDAPAEVQVAEGSAPAASKRKRMYSLRKDDHCLELGANEVFYPLYDTPDNQLRAESIHSEDPEISNITINLSELAVEVLKISRGNGIAIESWPIVIKGPVRFCGSVDIQFQVHRGQNTFSPYRGDRVEIGPNVIVNGARNVSMVSSQLTNIEITGNCSKAATEYNSKTPCIRFEEDARSSSNHTLYFRHDGPSTCEIDRRNLTDLELRLQGHSRNNPVGCRVVEEYSESIDYSPGPAPAPSLMIQPANSTYVNSQTIVYAPVRHDLTCDGPYIALIRPTEVDVNYRDVRPTQPTQVIAPQPVVVAEPVPVAVIGQVRTVNPKTMESNIIPADPVRKVNPKTMESNVIPAQKVAKAKAPKKAAAPATSTASANPADSTTISTLTTSPAKNDPMINPPHGDK